MFFFTSTLRAAKSRCTKPRCERYALKGEVDQINASTHHAVGNLIREPERLPLVPDRVPRVRLIGFGEFSLQLSHLRDENVALIVKLRERLIEADPLADRCAAFSRGGRAAFESSTAKPLGLYVVPQCELFRVGIQVDLIAQIIDVQ